MINNNHNLLLVQTKFVSRNELVVTVRDENSNATAMLRWKFRNTAVLESDVIEEVSVIEEPVSNDVADQVEGGATND